MVDYELVSPYGDPVYADEVERMHDELLDEIYPPVVIGIYTWEPARVLKMMDPVAYRVSVIEYVDQMVEQGAFIERVKA